MLMLELSKLFNFFDIEMIVFGCVCDSDFFLAGSSGVDAGLIHGAFDGSVTGFAADIVIEFWDG